MNNCDDNVGDDNANIACKTEDLRRRERGERRGREVATTEEQGKNCAK
jgi:hypothetical protein